MQQLSHYLWGVYSFYFNVSVSLRDSGWILNASSSCEFSVYSNGNRCAIFANLSQLIAVL